MTSIDFFFTRETFLVFGCLVLIALTALLSEFSGVINIALEGQLIVAVFVYALINFALKGSMAPVLVYLLAFCITIIAVFGFTMLFAFLTVTLRINKILVALAFNIAVLGLASLLIIAITDFPSFVSNKDYFVAYADPNFNAYLFANSFPIFVHFFVAIALMVFFYFFIYSTTTGLRIRAAGESYRVSKVMGLNPLTYRYLALAIGAVLISFAGLLFIEAQSSFSGSVYGYGYIGLALLNLGNRNVFLIMLFTFLFVILQTIAINSAGQIYVELYQAASYFIPIFFLTIYGAYLMFWKRTKVRTPQELEI